MRHQSGMDALALRRPRCSSYLLLHSFDLSPNRGHLWSVRMRMDSKLLVGFGARGTGTRSTAGVRRSVSTCRRRHHREESSVRQVFINLELSEIIPERIQFLIMIEALNIDVVPSLLVYLNRLRYRPHDRRHLNWRSRADTKFQSTTMNIQTNCNTNTMNIRPLKSPLV
jgi:hypothetical protein